MNSNNDEISQQSEQYYSAKSQFSEQSMSVMGDKEHENSATTLIGTRENTEEATVQPQAVQVSHKEDDTAQKDVVLKMFSDKTEANMLNYILNTKQ